MEKLAIGLMSGTSLDGIDIVLAKIKGVSLDTNVEVIKQKTYPLEEKLINKIKDAMDDIKSNSRLISSLNVELGYAFGHAVLSFCKDEKVNIRDIDFIASHGQTIYHISKDDEKYLRSSLQLGDGSVISQLCRVTVVSNFRLADIAHGGQGAPLVPYADYVLFSSDNISRAIHNIGGIANMTYLKKGGTLDEVIAFDSGPGNMMINEACQRLYHLDYDKDGDIAKSGSLIKDMYDELMSHSYYKQNYPKSTGREMFGSLYVNQWIDKYMNHKKEDLIHTFAMITVDSIVESYTELIKEPIDELVLCGGGAHNRFIIEQLKMKMTKTKIKVLEDLGYDSEFKEALAFIILGNQTLNRLPGNVVNATGAKAYTVLGQINYNY